MPNASQATHSHFGVYALVRNASGDILVIRKARGPYTGLFDLPGGSPEPEELLEETLAREIAEETGCTVQSATQLGAVSTRYEYAGENGSLTTLRHLGVLYSCTIGGIPRTTGDGEDSNGCLWLTPTPENLINCTPFTALAVNHPQR